MPREVGRQSNFTAGTLDPKMLGRRDLKVYQAALAEGENLSPKPAGPIGRRGGLAHVDRIRRRMVAISLTGATLDAPSGGDAAVLLTAGQLTTTAALSTVDPQVLVTIDFGAPTAVAAVDLIDFAVVPPGGDLDDAGSNPGQQFPIPPGSGVIP